MTQQDRSELPVSRRALLGSAGIAGAAFLARPDASPGQSPATHPAEAVDGGTAPAATPITDAYRFTTTTAPATARPALPDLRPAQWIWYPSGRTLPNTFVLLRRTLELTSKPKRALAWVSADSRYLLQVNGQRMNWGPAPCDPRWLEADPVDLTAALNTGTNVLAATVLYYGHGEGTYPMGKPGFLFCLDMEWEDGKRERIVSNAKWLAHLGRAWKLGQYPRWYLRSLQEEFDARRYPYGWTAADFQPDEEWLPAMAYGQPNRPPSASGYNHYFLDMTADPASSRLRARMTPLLKETQVGPARLAYGATVKWKRAPEDYFDYAMPDAFTLEPLDVPQNEAGVVELRLERGQSVALTYELPEQAVGWPRFTVDAPEGTVVEMLVQEAHDPRRPTLINSHFNAWARFICKSGRNPFEPFDYESCRWIQLVIRNAEGTVRVSDVGLRRRIYPWPHPAEVKLSDPALQKLMDATVNTLNNCAQETLVDGMGRERQQYSGDCGHQTHAIYFTFGDTKLPERFVTTFSQGLTRDGYFLDCWPAYDRLSRLMQRQVDCTVWGPLLDHGVGFNFDCWYHYLYTGDLEALREPYPRLLRFAEYLKSIQREDGLLPVEEIGVPHVWIDHVAYRRQREKQCAFNLYAAGMLRYALAPLCRAFRDMITEQKVQNFSEQLTQAAIRKFWSEGDGLFINNLPWLKEDKTPRTDDRSLASSILFDQCPGGRQEPALQMLAECPKTMGFSYPANAGWRLWALAKGGRIDAVINDLRTRWATLPSVSLNNTLQEDWIAHPDSGSQWSHCPVAPLYVLYMSIAGIQPLEPGFARCQIRPQLGDLDSVALTAHTVKGPIRLEAHGQRGQREMSITLPEGCLGELVLPEAETPELERMPGDVPPGHHRYRLAPGQKATFRLRHV